MHFNIIGFLKTLCIIFYACNKSIILSIFRNPQTTKWVHDIKKFENPCKSWYYLITANIFNFDFKYCVLWPLTLLFLISWNLFPTPAVLLSPTQTTIDPIACSFYCFVLHSSLCPQLPPWMWAQIPWFILTTTALYTLSLSLFMLLTWLNRNSY